MSNYVGLDVSQKTTMLCNVDGKGRRLRRGALPDCPFVTIEGPNPILTLPWSAHNHHWPARVKNYMAQLSSGDGNEFGDNYRGR